MSRFLQLWKWEPIFSGFLGVKPSPRNLRAVSGKVTTARHPSNLNSALGVNFFSSFLKKDFTMIYVHSSMTEKRCLINIFICFIATNSPYQNQASEQL